MLGWEFPPFFAGGVGIVCYELTKALSHIKDLEITYIMPYGPKDANKSNKTNHLNLLVANNNSFEQNINIKIETIDTIFKAYMSPEEYMKAYEDSITCNDTKAIELYGKNLYLEVERYAQKVKEIVKNQQFDAIHVHDWMTIPAGILAKEYLNCPLILHVHNTVYDRYLGEGCGHEKAIEIAGCKNANLIISISNKIKQTLIEKYNTEENKIRLVHNGGITDIKKYFTQYKISTKETKYVLFAGRTVLQKGPEYFVRTAQKVLEYEPDTKFIVAGSGHMLPQCIELSAQLGISKNIYFHGFFTREEADKFYTMADIFVMPSISEPFGIVPLEAISKGTATIISKQSGISECLYNCFKVDFWDIDETANKIISLLRYEPLHTHMRHSAYHEFDNFTWEKPAQKIHNIYKEAIQNYKNILLNN